MLGWAALGAVFLGLVFICARVMRRGLRTLDDDRKAQLEKIAEGKRKLAEDARQISAEEQLYITRRAVEDLLKMQKGAAGAAVQEVPWGLLIKSPGDEWRIELKMKELELKSSHKLLHGQGRWILCHKDHCEDFMDLGEMMAALNKSLQGGESDFEYPFHIARRISATRNSFGRRT